MSPRSDILTSLVTDLAAITGVASVRRGAFTPEDVPGIEWPFIGVYVEREERTRAEVGRVWADLTINANVFVRKEIDVDAFTALDALMDEISAAIEANTGRDGSAVRSDVRKIQFYELPDRSEAVGTMEILVRYRRAP